MSRRGQSDAHYKRAKQEGYAARSVYKLQEMDRRYGLLRPGQAVLDLGCHPGSWLQYASERVGKNGLVVGVDLQDPVVRMKPWTRFIKADVGAITAEEIRRHVPAFDAVLSDVAPRTTGVSHADQAGSLRLSEAAVELALDLLKPGGNLVVKVYVGPGVDDLIRRVKGAFKMGKGHKPDASRRQSREIYILGRGLKASAGQK